jgi:hypothetical protein
MGGLLLALFGFGTMAVVVAVGTAYGWEPEPGALRMALTVIERIAFLILTAVGILGIGLVIKAFAQGPPRSRE